MLALLFTFSNGLISLKVKRSYAAIPFLLVTFLIPLQAKIVISGIDLFMLRIIILFGVFRVFIRNEYKDLSLNKLDYLIIAWVLCNSVLYISSHPDSNALTNRLGFILNTFGSYFFLRCVVRDLEDIHVLIKWMAVIVIIIGFLMLLEMILRDNMFGHIWSVNQKTIYRQGELRCIGPFSSPILAGTFGASTIPLVAFLWFTPSERRLVITTVIAAFIIVIASNSSGPKLTTLVGIGALIIWRWRHNLKLIRRSVIISLVILNFIMSSPVWYLMSRISGYVGGGTGWHRSEIISQAIKHFDEWWLAGTDYTAHWMPYALPANPKMTDITNFYLVQGVHGGLLTMSIFIIVIWVSFQMIGDALSHFGDTDKIQSMRIWTIGATFFAHCITFLSVSYFDQTIFLLYMIFAFSSALKIPDSDVAHEMENGEMDSFLESRL